MTLGPRTVDKDLRVLRDTLVLMDLERPLSFLTDQSTDSNLVTSIRYKEITGAGRRRKGWPQGESGSQRIRSILRRIEVRRQDSAVIM